MLCRVACRQIDAGDDFVSELGQLFDDRAGVCDEIDGSVMYLYRFSNQHRDQLNRHAEPGVIRLPVILKVAREFVPTDCLHDVKGMQAVSSFREFPHSGLKARLEPLNDSLRGGVPLLNLAHEGLVTLGHGEDGEIVNGEHG